MMRHLTPKTTRPAYDPRRARVVLGGCAALLLSAPACRQILGYDDLTQRQPESSECTRRSDCDANQLCVSEQGRCVDVPRTCTVFPSDLFSNPSSGATTDPLMVAAFVPDFTTGPFLAMRHAIERINVTGLPGARAMGALMCTSLDDPKGTFDYLVENLQVPAIVTGFDNNLLYAATQEHAEKTFVLNVSAANTDLVASGQQGYLLNMLGAVESLGPTYPLLVDGALATLGSRAEPTDGGPASTPRVEVVYDDTAINNDLGKDIQARLRSRGVETSGLCVNQASAGVTEQCGYTAATAREELIRRAPDVIVALISDLNFATLVEGTGDQPGLDRLRRSECGDDGACLPLWITGPTNAREVAAYVKRVDEETGTLTTARRRFVGVQYAGPRERAQRDAWLASMKDGIGAGVDPAVYASAENYYDAFFYLAYGSAAAGVGKGNADARAFSLGIKSLLPTAPITDAERVLLPSEIRESFGKIEAERERSAKGGKDPSFDLFGASGYSHEISPLNNTWRSVGGVYCIRQDAVAGHYPSYDLLRYVTDEAGQGEGALLRTDDDFCQGGVPVCGFRGLRTYCNP